MTTKTRQRSPERTKWLSDVLTTAVENDMRAVWSDVLAYHHSDGPAWVTLEITDPSHDVATEGPRKRTITIDDIARGVRLYLKDAPADSTHFAQFALSNRTNGEDGDYDAIGAVNALECAIFGEVVYG